MNRPTFVAALGLLSLFLAATGCSRIGEEELISAASLLIEDRLVEAYREEFYSGYGYDVPWLDDGSIQLKNDRLPTWAQSQYSVCICWQADFLYQTAIQRRGQDGTRERNGTGWGWLFMNRELEFHFAELGLRWQELEDGEEIDSGEKLYVDAWEETLE